jgi:ubiquinone/menaquinone biosynthesis C-methylase UbiE
MKLNINERLFIISPLRRFLQDHLETRQLIELGGTVEGAKVLEVGCGPGYAIDLIYRKFGAASVDAFDLDPRMVARTQSRQEKAGRRSRLWVGNVRDIPVADSTYDAVFNFGSIHHVVDWRASLDEIHRVLKPGGHFYCEEILSRYITHPIIGRLMDHPREDRFDETQFINALGDSGFQVHGSRSLADLYLWVVATTPK